MNHAIYHKLKAMYSEIDVKISEKHSLINYGSYGVEVQRGNRCVKVFNSHKTTFENWKEAVAWAEANKCDLPSKHIQPDYNLKQS